MDHDLLVGKLVPYFVPPFNRIQAFTILSSAGAQYLWEQLWLYTAGKMCAEHNLTKSLLKHLVTVHNCSDVALASEMVWNSTYLPNIGQYCILYNIMHGRKARFFTMGTKKTNKSIKANPSLIQHIDGGESLLCHIRRCACILKCKASNCTGKVVVVIFPLYLPVPFCAWDLFKVDGIPAFQLIWLNPPSCWKKWKCEGRN